MKNFELEFERIYNEIYEDGTIQFLSDSETDQELVSRIKDKYYSFDKIFSRYVFMTIMIMTIYNHKPWMYGGKYELIINKAYMTIPFNVIKRYCRRHRTMCIQIFENYEPHSVHIRV